MSEDLTTKVAYIEEWCKSIQSTLDAILASDGKTVKSTAVSGTSPHQHRGGNDGGPLSQTLHTDYDELTAIATPGTPAAGKLRLYAKLSGGIAKLFFKQSDGTEVGPLA